MLGRARVAGELTLSPEGDFQLLSADGVASEPQSYPAATGTERNRSGSQEASVPTSENAAVRVVVVDLETAVRARVDDGGALTRRIWQIGAVRTGEDRRWVEAATRFERFVELPDGYDVPLHCRARHSGKAISADVALPELVQWLDGADVLVAYNGEQLDFPVLDEALASVKQEIPAVERVDGLYLAHCLWPAARSHRLAQLADEIGVVRPGRAHDATNDAVLLADLLVAGARELAQVDGALRELVRLVGRDSPAWRLLLGLRPSPPADGGHSSVAEISALLSDLLGGQAPRRGPVPSALKVPEELLDGQRDVTPAALAQALHRRRMEPRPAQQLVADAITSAARAGRPVLVEAPTGTGKSLSALAAALNWLAADPSHRTIISTHTKQLQNQLANELARLSSQVPGLLETTDVVKGSSNRLSLRGLVHTLADATGSEPSAAAPPARFLQKRRFRELLIFLLFRLVHPEKSKTYRWIAHSVDPVDLPAFFQSYCGTALPLWTTGLSQSAHGEWRDPKVTPLASHTDEVWEALSAHRLVIANHALLLTHWEDLAARADATLLIADEAHALEDAATDALSAALSADDVDDALATLTHVLTGLRSTSLTVATDAAVAELSQWWRQRRFRTALSGMMDARAGQAQVGARTLTLASPHTGARAARDARVISRILKEFAGQLGRVLAQLGSLLDAARPVVDVFDLQRLAAARQRLSSLRENAEQLRDTVDGLVPAEPEQLALESGEEAARRPAVPDRVVFAGEDGQIDRRGLAHYRVTVTASPIELPNDQTWQSFLASFTRMALLSATLTVATPGADRWTYTRSRLGMHHADAVELPGPFDYREQARLVALSDFPSWAEQPRQAMRTVAHQIAGFTREVTRTAEPDNLAFDDDGPWMHGAMVLTTSRNAAGGIADELTLLHAGDGRSVPVHNQVLLGTARAVAEFTGDESHHGGVLVGTRGLWTGVDVSEPGRNHLVWINKLPFPVFTAPVVAARRESVRRAAEDQGLDDPDNHANATYYLPLAALDLRQAVGRLIRNHSGRGVIVISDRKLSGDLPLRRLYREVFLGSLDAGLLVADPDTGEVAGGNVLTMRQAWARIWPFLAEVGVLPRQRLSELTTPEALDRHTLLPATLAIRDLEMSEEEVAVHRAEGTLEEEVVRRCEKVAGLLAGEPRTLRTEQRTAIEAVAAGRDSLVLLPTGYGKSYCYQLPALVLPGVTVVISPLISLMHDQALGLNHTIGGAVRALVASLPESVSRTGRTEVVEALGGDTRHGIKIVYVSPERLSQARFRQALRRGIESGALCRVAIDEAHTYVQWGDDFRPSFRRAGALLRELRSSSPGKLVLQALTATATPTVEASLRDEVLAGLVPGIDSPETGSAADLVVVRANPIRPELTLGRRAARRGSGTRKSAAALAEQIVDAETGHTIIYCLTVRETDWLHAHLRDHLDGRRVVLRKFHGRLAEVDKAAVSLEFKEAGKVESGADRVVVVATSAFGLGVDRADVRTVFCASPPTDLAALYQQLGRGGRDVAGKKAGELEVTTHALAYATSRSLGTAEWMAQLDLDPAVLRRLGVAAVHSARAGRLDASSIVTTLLRQDVEAGRITAAQAKDPRRRDEWTVGLTRAVAALADLGVITDGGDVPAVVSVRPGTRPPETELGRAVANAVTALPLRGSDCSQTAAPLEELHACLAKNPACAAAGFLEAALGLAELWLLLCDMHDSAALDVSQRPNDRMLIAANLVDTATSASASVDLPATYMSRVQGKLARARTEATHLHRFFSRERVCLNRRLAEYFSVDMPAECCSSDRVRCSVCAGALDGPGTTAGTPLDALVYGKLQPDSVDPATRAARLDDSVSRLVASAYRGLTPRVITSVLNGKDREWVATISSWRPVPRWLRDVPQFGRHPDATRGEVGRAIDRLVMANVLIAEEHLVRTVANVTQGEKRRRGTS
ncbi:ATP-dependent DNA helicase, RecQ family [Lentzea albidocapillata]|uniref:DNA 3'-5' helicase n=1 Tax=Lentzea albidocapillata TaxID=40571 RepID=A0A1W2FSG2_9PSEU|nr:ATP-dependent DNA helicase, RecQ family [Lentzea albidocapillata]